MMLWLAGSNELLNLVDWVSHVLFDIVEWALNTILYAEFAGLVKIWEGSFPFWLKVKIELTVLVLEEQLGVTKLASDNWWVQVEFSNEDLVRFGFSLGEDFEEKWTLGNSEELVCEVLFEVGWEHGLEFIWGSEDELEGELEVLNFFSFCVISWHLIETNVLQKRLILQLLYKRIYLH